MQEAVFELEIRYLFPECVTSTFALCMCLWNVLSLYPYPSFWQKKSSGRKWLPPYDNTSLKYSQKDKITIFVQKITSSVGFEPGYYLFSFMEPKIYLLEEKVNS